MTFSFSVGMYAFNRRVLQKVPATGMYGIDSLVIDMLARGDLVNRYPHAGYWLDLDTPDDYDRATYDIERLPGLVGDPDGITRQ